MPKLLDKAKKEGVRYLGLTDYQSMSGFPAFYHFCAQEGIKPLFGYDTEIEGHGFTLYVKSEEGYRNLLQIGQIDSKGELSFDYLRAHFSGLAMVYHVEQSPYFLYPFDESDAATKLRAFCKGFDDFYLGLPFGKPYTELVKNVRQFTSKYPYPLIAFPHVCYEKKEDEIVLRIVRAIASDEKLTEKKANGYSYWLSQGEFDEFYTSSEKEAVETFINSLNFAFLQKRGGLLTFPVPEGETPESYLRKSAYEGLKQKNPNADKRYFDRLDYELGVIHQMGYDSYFLLVADYVHFAKTHGVLVGPGRGSGAGSLVSYALDIVRPDPIKYDLLFERFLNPMRLSMPDIDVDFSDTKRELVVTYLIQKYGVEHVGHIITMQTLGPKASLRDIGRVFDYPSHDIDVLSKTIPSYPQEDLRQNYRKNPSFRQIVDSDPYYLEIVALASRIEGLPRQSGLHAAGIVLNDSPLSTSIPVKADPTSGSVVGFEMNYLEEQGFLKMDILGLRNLSIIERALQLIAKEKSVELDYQEIPYDDEKAIRLIAENKTMGLFQLESPGMNRAIAEVKPTSFEDVVAIIALFRPGPMENIPSYARRKQGLEPISYPHPILKEILAPTYGIIIYQEQIMQIVCKMALFSLGQADLFRRAISKKNVEKLTALREDFVNGCAKNNIPLDKANEVFDLIAKFANYGFNKSHALAYGMLACQMAYLKAYYPHEFYCAILDGTATNDPKFPAMVSEIKRSGLTFGVPLINEADISFAPKTGKILFPFTAIKGIQYALCRGIVEDRELNGPYVDIFDFALRTKKYGLNQSSLVKLIDAGCFDAIHPQRGALRLASSSALNYAQNFVGEDGQALNLGLDFAKPEIIPIEENRMGDLLAEKEVLGLMVSGSPLENRKEEIQAKKLASINRFLTSKYPLYIVGIVSRVKTIITKKGKKMAFLTIYDDHGEIELTLFADEYDRAYPVLKEGTAITLLAKKDTYGNKMSYLASDIKAL